MASVFALSVPFTKTIHELSESKDISGPLAEIAAKDGQ